MVKVTKNSKQKILDFFELRDKIEQVVKNYVQDKTVPLDDRWEIFEKSGFGEHQYYSVHLDSLHDDIVMYDGLVHADRHQSISVFEIIEKYNENKEDFEKQNYAAKNFLEWQKYKFDPIAFKEECISKFLKGWDHDW